MEYKNHPKNQEKNRKPRMRCAKAVFFVLLAYNALNMQNRFVRNVRCKDSKKVRNKAKNAEQPQTTPLHSLQNLQALHLTRLTRSGLCLGKVPVLARMVKTHKPK